MTVYLPSLLCWVTGFVILQLPRVVCPLQLRRGVFTTSAVDNIDHNPSSTSAQGSLHGTGISIFNQKLASLPEAYTNVPPATLVKCDPPPKQRPSSLSKEHM